MLSSHTLHKTIQKTILRGLIPHIYENKEWEKHILAIARINKFTYIFG